MFKKYSQGLLLLFTLINPSYSLAKEVAITIDDLPFVGFAGNDPGKLKREEERIWSIIQSLIDNKIPATCFVIAGNIENTQWELLERIQQAGFIIGNHTYSHENLNTMNAEKYIANVDKADKILAPLMSSPKYFRYPFLAEGQGEKRKRVLHYLAANHYLVAPVTIDSKDFVFNARLYSMPYRVRLRNLNRIKQQYLAYLRSQIQRADRIAKNKDHPVKEILLIHSNLLNSYSMEDIITLFKQYGYSFISLPEALGYPPENSVKNSNVENDDVNNSMVDLTSDSSEGNSITNSPLNPNSAVKDEKLQFEIWR